MTRRMLAVIAAMALSGCQHSGQQVVDPFWGQQRVPPPATGSVGASTVNPAYPQTWPPQGIAPPGTPLSNGLQTSPPNLLPAQTGTPGAATPIPATPWQGSGTPPGNGPTTLASPPSSTATPARAPLSGYSNPDWTPSSGQGLPAATTPDSGPAGSYPGRYASQSTTPGGSTPPTGGATPLGPPPGTSSPTGPVTTPASSGSLSPASVPSSATPDYFPPNGSYKYDGSP